MNESKKDYILKNIKYTELNNQKIISDSPNIERIYLNLYGSFPSKTMYDDIKAEAINDIINYCHKEFKLVTKFVNTRMHHLNFKSNKSQRNKSIRDKIKELKESNQFDFNHNKNYDYENNNIIDSNDDSDNNNNNNNDENDINMLKHLDNPDMDYFLKIRENDMDFERKAEECLIFENDIIIFYFLHNFTTPNPLIEISIFYNQENNNNIDKLKDFLSNYKFVHTEQPRGSVSFVCSNNGNLFLKEFPTKKLNFDINNQFNDDLAEFNDNIIKKLHKNSVGIVLLHGIPGTGKTTYLRYLTNKIAKRFIYLPPDHAHAITKEDFLPFLMDYPNSILIIEDAENILQERNGGANNAVSNLLNLSDGLIGDGLNIQIICTFNTNINKIDGALKRKGRLLGQYEFRPLRVDKCNNLFKKLNMNKTTDRELTLTQIFNDDEEIFDNHDPEKNYMGFKTNNHKKEEVLTS